MEVDNYVTYAADDNHHIDLCHPRFQTQQISYDSPLMQGLGAYHRYQAQQPVYTQHLASIGVDVKPRLTKEQHDVLEAHYNQQNKPNTQTKKTFANKLGVSLDKVNVSNPVCSTLGSFN